MSPLPESAPSAAPAIPAACPVCAEPLESEDRFCGHCGHDVSAPAPAGHAPGTPVGAQRTGAPSGTAGDGADDGDADDGDSVAFRIAPPGAAPAAPPGPPGPAGPAGPAAERAPHRDAAGDGTGRDAADSG